MASISETVADILAGDSNVSTLVGARIRSDILNQRETLPAITYFTVDTVPNEILTAVADVFRARIQIDAYGQTRTQANSVADTVRLSLQKNRRGTFGTTHILEINLVTGERHFVDPAESGSDQRRFVTSQDFHVHYRPAT